MTLSWASGAHIALSSADVMLSTQVAFGLATTARPSYAIGSSMKSTPAFAHASVSVALIGREASLMSVSARQNFWKPPPVPEMPTVTRTPGLAFWNSSATASLTGKTVLDPSSVTTEGAAEPAADGDWLPPHPASTSTATAGSKNEVSTRME